MPEWKADISAYLANLRLTLTREAAIVDGLAQRLDEALNSFIHRHSES